MKELWGSPSACGFSGFCFVLKRKFLLRRNPYVLTVRCGFVSDAVAAVKAAKHRKTATALTAGTVSDMGQLSTVRT